MHQTQWSPERPLPPPVSLASQSHHEKPPEVTCTRRGNPGFPASTRESPRETSFNTSRGQIPLPWLGSNDALPFATRMETRLPWRPTRGSLTSPSYLVRNRTLGQNGHGRTIVAPYSVRPLPGAPASCPLQWREVTSRLDPARFTIKTLPAYIDKTGDPLAPILTGSIDMAAAIARIETNLGRE